MAEGAKEGGEDGFSFVDKVRLMMYTEQEKEAFLIDKKEKEEKKKAKERARAAGEDAKNEKKSVFGQIKSFFVPEQPKECPPKVSSEESTIPEERPPDATG